MTDIILKHWTYYLDSEKIAWAIFDKQSASVNTLDTETLEELEAIIQGTESNESIGLVIQSGKASRFIAGADIAQFQRCQNPDEGLKLVLYGQAVFSRLEKMQKPSLVIIDGACMGGGMELALASSYRIACDHEATQMGLPEIKLGIHPGWGGTVRLPKLIGAFKALPLMLSGRSLSAYQAYSLGIVDYLLPKRECARAASCIIKQHHQLGFASIHSSFRKKMTAYVNKISNMPFLRPLIAYMIRKQMAKKTIISHYPALEALISQWEKHGTAEEAYAYEAASLVSLFRTETSQHLIRLFFLQNRMKSLVSPLSQPSESKIGHVHVIGAGTMGGDIAAWCALNGIKVSLQDKEGSYIVSAITRAKDLFNKKLKLKHLIQAANDRLIPDLAGDGVAHADIIIEAIYENLEAKQALFKAVEAKAKSSAILATNTSSIPLDEINKVLLNPSRLLGIHFFNPVSMMQLVEIVKGDKTSDEAICVAASFVKQIKRLPLKVKSHPGFLVNRILMPYLMESVLLVEEGVSLESIDSAAMQFGMPMGPIELADTVGLDICLSVAQELTQHMGGEVPNILKNKVAQKQLGKKTSQGFYQYEKGKKQACSLSSSLVLDQELIADRLIYRILNESALCLSEGIVDEEDMLDAGMVFGTGFAPFRGGPLSYAHAMGSEHILARFKKLEEKYGQRFKAHPYFL